MLACSDIEASDPQIEKLRQNWGKTLYDTVRNEFDAPGIYIDHRYYGSKSILHDNLKAPTWNQAIYSPFAKASHRAPCLRLKSGKILYDLFGIDFNLLVFEDAEEGIVKEFRETSDRLGITLTILKFGKEEAKLREIYIAPLVLVRPDNIVIYL